MFNSRPTFDVSALGLGLSFLMDKNLSWPPGMVVNTTMMLAKRETKKVPTRIIPTWSVLLVLVYMYAFSLGEKSSWQESRYRSLSENDKNNQVQQHCTWTGWWMACFSYPNAIVRRPESLSIKKGKIAQIVTNMCKYNFYLADINCLTASVC